MSRSYLRALRILLVGAGLASLANCAADAGEPAPELARIDETLRHPLPKVPASLAVPKGNRLAFALPATGVQIYDCKVGSNGAVAWTFRAPEAELSLFGFVVISHYAGPTWEALDGSSVVGTRVAGETVDATAIPWLLLQAASHAGKGLMTHVTYIQRLNTTGGLVPEKGCDASTLGAVEEVPYTALYAFYTARAGQ